MSMAYFVDPCHIFRRSLPHISAMCAVPFGKMGGGRKILRGADSQVRAVLTMARNMLRVGMDEARRQSLKMDLMRRDVGTLPDKKAVEAAHAILESHVASWHDGVRAYKPRLTKTSRGKVMKLSWIESGPRGTQFSMGVDFDMRSLTKESAAMTEVMES